MRVKLLPMVFLLTFLLAGCWDFKQIDNYYILTGLGVDKDSETNELIVTTRVPAPITGLQTSSTFTREGRVISRKGRSILEATQRIGNELKKEIYLGHLQVIIISKEAAETGINNIIDSVSRNPQIQRKLYVMLSEGRAKEVIGAINQLDVAPIQDISNMLDINKTNYYIPVTLDQFLYRYRGVGFDPSLPIISSKNNIVEVSGMGIFKNDKLVGELSGEETRAMSLLISPDFSSEYYTVQKKINDRHLNNLITIETKHVNRNIKVYLKENHIDAHLKIKLIGKIVEYPMWMEEEDDEKVYEIASKHLEEYIKSNLERVIEKSKKYNSDLLGIGKYVRAKHMSYWDEINWDEEYRNTDFKIDIEVVIESSASIKLKLD